MSAHGFDQKKFNHSLGVDATVERTKFKGDVSTNANAALRKIGEDVHPEPGVYEYLGSAAMHIYATPHTKHLISITQTATLKGCDELIAIPASENFMGDVIEFYTGKRPGKRRSGF